MLGSQRTPPAASPRPAAFLRHRRAASAVEFALVLPLILMIFVGMSEMSHAIDNWRKVTLSARTVADLTAQGDLSNPMAASTMKDILAAVATVLQPFSAADVSVVVSALGVDLTASPINPRVCSSVANANGVARAVGLAADLTIPPSFLSNGNRYILAEVRMPYTPMMGTTLVALFGGINGAIPLTASFTWPTRGGTTYKGSTTEIVLPGGSACS